MEISFTSKIGVYNKHTPKAAFQLQGPELEGVRDKVALNWRQYVQEEAEYYRRFDEWRKQMIEGMRLEERKDLTVGEMCDEIAACLNKLDVWPCTFTGNDLFSLYPDGSLYWLPGMWEVSNDRDNMLGYLCGHKDDLERINQLGARLTQQELERTRNRINEEISYIEEEVLHGGY